MLEAIPQLATALGIAVALVSLIRAGWAVAQFFSGLSEGLNSLTKAVTTLTDRFDEHTQVVGSDLADVRERVAGLESWRVAHEEHHQ